MTFPKPRPPGAFEFLVHGICLLVSAASFLFKAHPKQEWTVWESVLCGVLILFFGIPHGAVDHLLLYSRKLSNVQFYGGYLLLLSVHLLLWWALPYAALALFFGMSAYHFGNAELPDTHFLVALSRGLVILSWIVVQDSTVLRPFLETPSMVLVLAAHVLHAATLPLDPHPRGHQHLLQLARLVLLFSLCHVYVAFSLYFGLCHALEAMRRLHTRFHWSAWLPHSLAALLGLGLAALLLLPALSLTNLWTAFVYFISVLTTPHVVYSKLDELHEKQSCVHEWQDGSANPKRSL